VLIGCFFFPSHHLTPWNDVVTALMVTVVLLHSNHPALPASTSRGTSAALGPLAASLTHYSTGLIKQEGGGLVLGSSSSREVITIISLDEVVVAVVEGITGRLRACRGLCQGNGSKSTTPRNRPSQKKKPPGHRMSLASCPIISCVLAT